MKLSKFIASLCCVIVCSLLIIPLFSCDDSVRSMNHVSPTSGKTYLLPIKARKMSTSGLFYNFSSDDDIESLCKNLQENNYTCEIFNDTFLLIKDKLSETRTNYLVICCFGCGRSTYYGYQYGSPVLAFGPSTVYLFPFHLSTMTGEELRSTYYGLFYFDLDKEYSVYASFQDVKTFYEEAGIFNVTEDGDTLNITVRDDVFVYRHSKKPFSIVTRTDEDGQFFITLRTESES